MTLNGKTFLFLQEWRFSRSRLWYKPTPILPWFWGVPVAPDRSCWGQS